MLVLDRELRGRNSGAQFAAVRRSGRARSWADEHRARSRLAHRRDRGYRQADAASMTQVAWTR